MEDLHPNIHWRSRCRDLDSHLEAAKDDKIELIDLVVVNLYPFKENDSQTRSDVRRRGGEHDIGGPSMLRSASETTLA